jgi:hypothetical protein
MTNAQQIIADAIDESILRDMTVEVADTEENRSELGVHADDDCDCEDDFWGEIEGRGTWRVRIQRA